ALRAFRRRDLLRNARRSGEGVFAQPSGRLGRLGEGDAVGDRIAAPPTVRYVPGRGVRQPPSLNFHLPPSCTRNFVTRTSRETGSPLSLSMNLSRRVYDTATSWSRGWIFTSSSSTWRCVTSFM